MDFPADGIQKKQTSPAWKHWFLTRPRLSIMLVIALGTTVVLGLLGTNGTLALWRITGTGNGTVSIGNLSVQFRDVGGSNASPSDGGNTSPKYSFSALSQASDALLPGNTVYSVFEARNTGDVPISLSFTGITPTGPSAGQQALTSSLRVGAVLTASGACGPAQFAQASLVAFSSVTTTTPIVLNTATNAISPAATGKMCVALSLDAAAPASAQSAAITYVITSRADQQRPTG